jgi:hypothetical protein
MKYELKIKKTKQKEWDRATKHFDILEFLMILNFCRKLEEIGRVFIHLLEALGHGRARRIIF